MQDLALAEVELGGKPEDVDAGLKVNWEWREKWRLDSSSPAERREYDVSPDRRAKAVDEVAKIPRAELPVSDTVRTAEGRTPYRGWLAAFDCRLKGRDRLMEKVLESSEAERDATPEEVIVHIPDAIRYTFCFRIRRLHVGDSGDVKAASNRLRV